MKMFFFLSKKEKNTFKSGVLKKYYTFNRKENFKYQLHDVEYCTFVCTTVIYVKNALIFVRIVNI